jgi:hypothetical protein
VKKENLTRAGGIRGGDRAAKFRGGDRGWSATRALRSRAAQRGKGDVTAIGFGCRLRLPGS